MACITYWIFITVFKISPIPVSFQLLFPSYFPSLSCLLYFHFLFPHSKFLSFFLLIFFCPVWFRFLFLPRTFLALYFLPLLPLHIYPLPLPPSLHFCPFLSFHPSLYLLVLPSLHLFPLTPLLSPPLPPSSLLPPRL